MDYNRNNVNLLNEQIDINSGLITELERLEAQSLASRMETSSLNKIINDLRATIGSVNHELQVTKQRLASAEREREQVTKELQDDRNGNASMVYETRWDKKSHCNQDISTVEISEIPDHDLLVGGFPCQDYSVATTLKNSKGLIGKKGCFVVVNSQNIK